MPSDDLEVLLTDAQIAEWRERGFTHVERLTTDAEVEWLRERFDEVFDPSNKGLIGGYFDASAPITADIADVPDLGQSSDPSSSGPTSWRPSPTATPCASRPSCSTCRSTVSRRGPT